LLIVEAGSFDESFEFTVHFIRLFPAFACINITIFNLASIIPQLMLKVKEKISGQRRGGFSILDTGYSILACTE
jgi:hypothetical protein